MHQAHNFTFLGYVPLSAYLLVYALLEVHVQVQLAVMGHPDNQVPANPYATLSLVLAPFVGIALSASVLSVLYWYLILLKSKLRQYHKLL
jgi:phosphate/sulfate permease